MFLFASYYVSVWEIEGNQSSCLWNQGFLKQGYLLLCTFTLRTVFSHQWYWMSLFVLCYIQGFQFVHVCVSLSVVSIYAHICLICWFVFVFWGRIAGALIRKLGTFESWSYTFGLEYFYGQAGFCRASLTAKKQVVPSPATTSTQHRSTQKSVCLIPLFPLSAGLEAGHLRILWSHRRMLERNGSAELE